MRVLSQKNPRQNRRSQNKHEVRAAGSYAGQVGVDVSGAVHTSVSYSPYTRRGRCSEVLWPVPNSEAACASLLDGAWRLDLERGAGGDEDI